MREAILIVQRQAVYRKAEWRLPGAHRTLDPLNFEPLLFSLWGQCQTQKSRWCVASAPFANKRLDGAEITPFSSRGQFEVFDIEFTGKDQANLTLLENQVLSRAGLPHRPTRKIAVLRPCHPLRVILNGKIDSRADRLFRVLDYHIVLGVESPPSQLPSVRSIDLQEKLW